MVSIKFWRGKFSRPATGYECIAHAPAFDRGVIPTCAHNHEVTNYHFPERLRAVSEGFSAPDLTE